MLSKQEIIRLAQEDALVEQEKASILVSRSLVLPERKALCALANLGSIRDRLRVAAS